MATEIKLPSLSENVSEGAVLELRVKEGGAIKEGDTLLVVEAEKSTVEVPSPVSGTLRKWLVKKGDVVKAGQALAQAESGDGKASKPPTKAPSKADQTPERESPAAAKAPDPDAVEAPDHARKTAAAVAGKSA